MRGPKPKPKSIKAQRAPVHSKRPPKPDLLPRVALPVVAAPAWLKDDGLRIWKRLAPRLTQAKLLSEIDRETFARYCRNFARWLKMSKALDDTDETYTVKTESGEVHRARPEFMIADRIERQLLAAEDRFGLNPAERQRIFAARAQAGTIGDLFGAMDDHKRRPQDSAAKPAEPVEPAEDPIGFLN